MPLLQQRDRLCVLPCDTAATATAAAAAATWRFVIEMLTQRVLMYLQQFTFEQ